MTQVDDSDRPLWDQQKAEAAVGAIVLIGLSYVDAQDNVLEQRQFYGLITKADARNGFAVEVQSQTGRGKTYWLPPHLDGLVPARPGQYRLRSTGETITDPDFTSNWRVTRPSEQPQ